MSFNFNWVSSATGYSIFSCRLQLQILSLLLQSSPLVPVAFIRVIWGDGTVVARNKTIYGLMGKLSQMKFTVLIIKSS